MCVTMNLKQVFHLKGSLVLADLLEILNKQTKKLKEMGKWKGGQSIENSRNLKSNLLNEVVIEPKTDKIKHYTF